jgi:hypothetical protein
MSDNACAAIGFLYSSRTLQQLLLRRPRPQVYCDMSTDLDAAALGATELSPGGYTHYAIRGGKSTARYDQVPRGADLTRSCRFKPFG